MCMEIRNLVVELISVNYTTQFLRSQSFAAAAAPVSSMSANHRLQAMYMPPVEIDVWWSLSVFCVIICRNKLKRMGESKHP